MIIGYARVSTNGQDLESQIEELKNKGAEKIYYEKFTGTRVDRPVFERVLKKLNIFSDFRDMIVTRTQEGKIYARMHNPNFREGRPKKQLSTSFSYSEHNESSY